MSNHSRIETDVVSEVRSVGSVQDRYDRSSSGQNRNMSVEDQVDPTNTFFFFSFCELFTFVLQ